MPIKKRRITMTEWMVVCTTFNSAEAEIVASRLRAEDIRAMVQQEPAGRVLGITVGALGEIKVLVHPDDYEQALDILDNPEPETLPDTTDKIVYRSDEDEPNE
jgi:hypothetical protein